MWLTCREAFYGGAAGGGKSDALLMAALQYVDVPGYAAILFRRTYADLEKPKALMDRAREWLQNTDAQWRDKQKAWLFPSGATVSFGYLETDRDKYNYQSAEYQFIGFDELTQFSEEQYTYLFSRLRRLSGSEVPLRMRAASNPGGVGHEWVKQRFIVNGRANGRIFIPAGIDDNTHLDREEYLQALAELDPVTRAQLQEGNWDIAAQGNKFKRQWFQIVQPGEVPPLVKQVRYWDLAATEPKPGKDPDYTAGAKMGVDADGIFYLLDMQRAQLTPLDVEKLVAQTAALDGREVAIWMEQEPGGSGKTVVDSYGRVALRGYDFHADKVTGSKEVRANPLSAAIQAGRVKLVAGDWNADFITEATMFPPPPNKGHDDQIDAAAGAHTKLTTVPSRVIIANEAPRFY